MTDAAPEHTPEQRLGLVLRGVQRMADGLGAIEQRLPDLVTTEHLKALAARIDEYRVRSRAELAQVAERVVRVEGDLHRSLELVTALAHAVDVVLREQQSMAEIVRDAPGDDGAAVQQLGEAVGALRDDLGELQDRLGEANQVLRTETAAAVERVAGEQAERALRLHEAIGEAAERAVAAVRDAPDAGDVLGELVAQLSELRQMLDGRHVALEEAFAGLQRQLEGELQTVREAVAAAPLSVPPAPPFDDSRLVERLQAVAEEVRRLHGEVVAGAGQLRTDVGARQAELRDEVLAAVGEQLGALQARLAPLELLGTRLDELRSGAAAMESLAERLDELQARAAPLDTVAERLDRLEARLGDLSQQPVLARLDHLEWRFGEMTSHDLVLARLEELAGLLGESSPSEPPSLEPVLARLDQLEARLAEVATATRPQEASEAPSEAPEGAGAVADRLAALEGAISALRRDLAGELEHVAQRDDLRRGVDRVLGAVSTAEQAVAGEVRAVDARVGGMADDLRLVRVLRDGLDALADGVDGVRQLAARTATSQQMGEVSRELGAVLTEIEAARSQVLRVDRSQGPVMADVVHVGAAEVDDLGRRIEHLAEVVEERLAAIPPSGDRADADVDAAQQVARRLRQVSDGARQLGNGVLEDLRSRRRRR